MIIETTTTKEPSISQIAKQEIPPLVKSAAPVVNDFVPPIPTPEDEYPGYYQLPNKQWAAYDPSYYQFVSKTWQPASVEQEMRRRAGPSERVRKQWQGDEEDLQQISAMDEASRAQAEIESSKQLTAEVLRSGPTAPNMTMTVRLLELCREL
jgi:proline-rich protein PRCC